MQIPAAMSDEPVRTYVKREVDETLEPTPHRPLYVTLPKEFLPPPAAYPDASQYVFAINYAYEWDHEQEDIEDDIDPENIPLPESEDELEFEIIEEDEEPELPQSYDSVKFELI